MSPQARVRIRHGNLFDRPSDLLVLPCDVDGSVGPMIQTGIQRYNIPFPKLGSRKRLGQVRITPYTDYRQLARVVVYVASVDTQRTSKYLLEHAMKFIGEMTTQDSALREIAAPLLGTGAGGLTSAESLSTMRDGFLSSAISTAVLVISVLQSSVYVELEEFRADRKSRRVDQQRVFFSYVRESPNRRFVLEVATELRNEGVEVRIDEWHLPPGMLIEPWMRNELFLADRVIVFSDQEYTQRANLGTKGVGIEAFLARKDLERQPKDGKKYLLVAMDGIGNLGIPKFLEGRFALDITPKQSGAEIAKELLRILRGENDNLPAAGPTFYVA